MGRHWPIGSIRVYSSFHRHCHYSCSTVPVRAQQGVVDLEAFATSGGQITGLVEAANT